MKFILLIIVLVLAAGCSGGKTDSGATNSGKPEQIVLQADVARKQTESGSVVEFTFYYYTYGPSDGKMENVTGKFVVEVENAAFNDVAMTRETDAAGQPVYRVEGKAANKENEIKASYKGKNFAGSLPLTGRANAMTRVTMRPA